MSDTTVNAATETDEALKKAAALKKNGVILLETAAQIEREITQLGVPKGKVRFFDGNDKRITDETGKGIEGNCADALVIPKGTKKIVANGCLNIKEAIGFDYLTMLALDDVTATGLDLRKFTAIRSLGSVNVKNSTHENSKANILVMCHGDATINGSFSHASANTGGSVFSDDRNTLFFDTTALQNLSIKRRQNYSFIYAGGKLDAPEPSETEQSKEGGKHTENISRKPRIDKRLSKPKESLKPQAPQPEQKKWQDSVKPESGGKKTADSKLTAEELLILEESAAFAKKFGGYSVDKRVKADTEALKQEMLQSNKKDWRGKITGELPSERIVEETASTIVKVLPSVHEAAKQIATAYGMSASNYLECLLIEAVKKNPDLIKSGGKLIKRCDGSQTAARNYAIREELKRLRYLNGNDPIAGHSNLQQPEPEFRAANYGEKTKSILVKPLPYVHEDANKLATANCMTLPQYLESLIVDSLNQNPDLIREGKCRIELANGSIYGARYDVLYQHNEELKKNLKGRSR